MPLSEAIWGPGQGNMVISVRLKVLHQSNILYRSQVMDNIKVYGHTYKQMEES